MTNSLWIARKQVGYPQKWVAALLGHHSLSVVSEYEHGHKVPNLETALKLEVILHRPVALLFPSLAARAERRVEDEKDRHQAIRVADNRMAAVQEAAAMPQREAERPPVAPLTSPTRL